MAGLHPVRAPGRRLNPSAGLAYPTLLILGALDAAGYSVIAPVVPQIAAATGAGPATMGALVATFPLGMAIGFAASGAAIRTHGTKTVILVALAIVATGCVGFVAGETLGVYFPARLLMGLGSGGLWIGITFDTLRRWTGQEYLCMSRIFAAYAAGGLIGPALGAIDGVAGPFLGYLLLVLVAMAPAALLDRPADPPRFTRDRSMLRLPGFRVASAAILFTVLGLGVVEGVLPLHFASGLDQAEIGLTYACVSALVAGTAALAARYRPGSDVLIALVLITAGIAIAGASASVAVWIIALVVTGVGLGLGNTGSIGLLLEAVPTERIVTAMVVWSQIGIAGYLLGPLLGGATAQTLGFEALGLVPLVAAVGVLASARYARTAADAAIATSDQSNAS